jgi:hypothetical protein
LCIDKSWPYMNSQYSPWLGLGEKHHLPFYSIFCEWPWGLHCNVIFLEGVLKFLKLVLPPLWKPIISCVNLQLRWGLKQICSPRWELFNDIWNVIFTHVIQGNSWLLIIKSQIDILILDPSFDHNLYYKYSNGSCEPMLNIYVLKYFQWYKEVLNLMNFDPWNRFLKNQDFIGPPTPKMRIHLGVCGLIPSHSLALPRVWMWLLGCIFDPHISMTLL